jgi:hypothetical protein
MTVPFGLGKRAVDIKNQGAKYAHARQFCASHEHPGIR